MTDKKNETAAARPTGKPAVLHVRAKDPSRPVPIAGTFPLAFIGAEPRDVPNDRYFRRRIQQGDLELVEPAKAEPAKKAKE